jgi:hypothetical protein
MNTLVLMRGAVAAQKLGIFGRFVDEIYRHMWAQPKQMNNPPRWRSRILTPGNFRPHSDAGDRQGGHVIPGGGAEPKQGLALHGPF